MKKIMTTSVIVVMGLIIASPSYANYQDAKAQYNKEKGFYKESRKQFLEERKKFRILKNEKNKARYEEAAKKHLEKVIDVLIAKLNRIEAWVNNRQALSFSEKQQIISEINDDKDWLRTKKNKIKGANKEGIKTNAKEVREYWKKSRARIKKVVGQVLVNRTELATKKADEAIVKIEEAIAIAKNNGKDVSNAEKLLADLKEKLSLAKKEVGGAKTAFNNISSIKDTNKFFREGHQHLRKAHSYLKEVRKIARMIVRDLR